MASRDFAGPEIVTALTRNRFHVVGRTGSHVKLRYEHPTTENDVRLVVVPMHDRVTLGTLREIADQAGANDFESFCDWIDRNS
jgi:predicted RNA binding protein YcfA (HicA-like mRNA interferase family)